MGAMPAPGCMVSMFTTSPIPSLLHLGHGGFFFPIVPILFLLALGALVWMFARRGRVGPVGWRPGGRPGTGGPHRGGFGPEDQAMSILRERLARGDISPEEYLERSSVLGSQRPSDPPAS